MEKNIDIFCEPTKQFIHFYDQDKSSDIALIQLGYHANPPGYWYGPMIRDHYLVHFIKSGKGILIVNNRKYQIFAGQCFLIEPNQIAYYESDYEVPLEYYWIGFTGYRALSYIKKTGFSYENIIRNIEADEKIFYEFSKVHTLGYSKDNLLAYQGLLYYILFYLTSTPAPTSLPSPFTYIDFSKTSQQEYVQKVINIIQSSYHCDLIIEDISTKLSLNHGYLTKLFKQHTGVSIKQYLINYRLNKSSILLRSPQKSITEIAQEVGFKDPLYFSKTFRKKYNMSPSEYRKRNPFLT